MWADSSKLTVYALAGYLPSLNPGDHPGWTVLAWAWLRLPGTGDPVLACHLLSSLLGGVAVGLAAALLGRAGHRPEGALVLAAAHPLWWAASLAETYAAAVLAVLLVAWLAPHEGAWPALGAGLAAGWGMAVHGLTAPLSLPLLAGLRRRRWPLAAAGAALGAAPVWLAVLGTPRDPLTGHRAAGGGAVAWHLRAFLDPGRALPGLAVVLALVALALGPLGALALLRRGRARPLHPWPAGGWIGLAALSLLLAGYAPYRLHLMVALLVVALVLLRPPRLGGWLAVAHVALQAALYLAAPLALERAGLGDLGVRRLPYRDNDRYFLWPWKAGDRGAGRYARELLAAAPPGAVVLADFNPGAVLALVERVRHLRPDVVVVPTAVDEALGAPDPAAALAARIRAAAPRPVVLADGWEPYYRLDELRSRFALHLARCGPGWLVSSPGSSPSARIQATASANIASSGAGR